MKRTVLITGASGGIGSAIARQLAENGDDIVIHYYQAEEKARQLQKELTEVYGVRAMTIQADVADEAAVDRMFTAVENELAQGCGYLPADP